MERPRTPSSEGVATTSITHSAHVNLFGFRSYRSEDKRSLFKELGNQLGNIVSKQGIICSSCSYLPHHRVPHELDSLFVRGCSEHGIVIRCSATGGKRGLLVFYFRRCHRLCTKLSMSRGQKVAIAGHVTSRPIGIRHYVITNVF